MKSQQEEYEDARRIAEELEKEHTEGKIRGHYDPHGGGKKSGGGLAGCIIILLILSIIAVAYLYSQGYLNEILK